MSVSAPEVNPAPALEPAFGGESHPWIQQLRGILRLETRRNLFGRRAFVLYFLALGPVALLILWALSPFPRQEMSGTIDAIPMFAGLFEGYLRTSLFLSALVLFMSLFRSEILNRSLHYYFLTPVRRELLVVGKFLSALGVIATVYGAGTALLYLTNFGAWGFGPLSRHLFQGPGMGHLLAYVGIAMLACLGYGALFLLAGLLFRNPVVPAVAVWGWEFVNFLLPPALKKLSVVFYLQSLYPVPMPGQLFSVFADPVPAWLSVPGLLIFTAAVLLVAAWRARRLQINYSGD